MASSPPSSTAYVCLICHNEIEHPGAECPHCKSRAATEVGATPLVLSLIFLVMVGFFVLTGLLTQAFHHEERLRAQLHANRARQHLDEGDYQRAIEEYREALHYSRNNHGFRLGLAVALYELGRLNEAEPQLMDLRSSDPTDAVVNRLLARLHAERGKFEEAVNYYQSATYGRWPRDPLGNRIRTRLELIGLLREQGQKRRMLPELLELWHEAPEDPELRKRIGWLFLEAGSPVHANEVFRKRASADPEDAEAYLGIGEAEFALGNYLTARTNLRRALRLDPENEQARNFLDLCERVNKLDPMFRGIGQHQQFVRSQETVKRVLQRLEACWNPQGGEFAGPPRPLPERLAADVATARSIVSGELKQERGDETIEANLSLTERLWRARNELCPEAEETDEPLRHVVRKLAR